MMKGWNGFLPRLDGNCILVLAWQAPRITSESTEFAKNIFYSSATSALSAVESYLCFSDSVDYFCRSGGIGRHTILRGWRREAWEFESPLRHFSFQISDLNF